MLFEALAADKTNERTAARKALVLSEVRVKEAFGEWLKTASQKEYDAKFSYVKDKFGEVVAQACDEVGGGDPAAIASALYENLKPSEQPREAAIRIAKNVIASDPDEFGKNFGDKAGHSDKDGCSKCDCSSCSGEGCGCCSDCGDSKESKTASPDTGYSQNDDRNDSCPECGSKEECDCDVEPDKDEKKSSVGGHFLADKHNPSKQDDKEDEEGATVLDALESEDRKTSGEMTPGHTMVDPTTGMQPYNPDNYQICPYCGADHTSPDGTCPNCGYQENSDPNSGGDILGPGHGGYEGYTGVSPEERWHGAKVAADAQDNTNLHGPSPKMDKRKWTPKTVEMPEINEKSVTEPIVALNDDKLEEIGEKDTETKKLPANKGDAGFDSGGVSKGPGTKTFPKGKHIVDPVTGD